MGEQLYHPAGWYLDKIRRGEGFTLSKWGDMELMAVHGRDRGRNCDGTEFTSEVAEEMQRTLQQALAQPREQYFIAVEPAWLELPEDHRCGRAVRDVYEKYDLHHCERHDLNAFHRLAVDGRIAEALQEFRKHPLLVAAPPFYAKIADQLRWQCFVPTGPDCWSRRDAILNELRAALIDCTEPAVVLVAGSVTANYVVDRLYQAFGDRHWLIDWGSTLDPYCGQLSRSFHRQQSDAVWRLDLSGVE